VTDNHEENLTNAQEIVNAYGHVLAQLDNGSWVHPVSCLPYDVDTIKSAIHLLLWELNGQDKAICNSLAQSYVFLAQFINDEEAAMAARGQALLQSSDLDPDELKYADKAETILNRVKLDMEALLGDVQAFLS